MQHGGLDPAEFLAGDGRTRRTLLTASLLMMSGVVQSAQVPKDEPLKIGVDANYPPYSFYDDNRHLTGLDPSLAREAGRRAGVVPTFVPIAWDRKNELMATGRIDCVWSCFSINGREDRYLWIPYLYSRQVVAVQKTSSIRTVADLEGKTVALQSGTRPETFFMQDPKAPQVTELIALPSTAEAFIAVRRGYADAVAGHEAVLQRLIKEVPGAYRVLDEPLLAVKVGVAFPLNSQKTELIKRLGTAMANMAREGVIERLASAYGLDGGKVVMMPAD